MSDTTWRSLQFIPDDVLFFRDGRPSAAGADHYLRSLFPPNPVTVYGAVRAALLAQAGLSTTGLKQESWRRLGDDLRTELGEWGGFGTLAMRGPWLVRQTAHGEEVLLPAPADLGLILEPKAESASDAETEPETRIRRVLRYRFHDERDAKTSWSHPLALAHPAVYDESREAWDDWRGEEDGGEPVGPAGWYLTAEGMSAWARDKTPSSECFVRASDLWLAEPRTGVGLEEKRRMAEAGKLYSFGHIRLRKRVGIGFEVRSKGLQPGVHVRLGGEGKTARLEEGPSFPAVGGGVGPQRFFTVCFATPAASRGGAYPPGFSAGNLEGALAGQHCRLVGAVVRGSAPAGGWDGARGAGGGPRPLRRLIPAGSVFRFENLEPEAALRPESGESLHGTCWCDDFADEKQAGPNGGALAQQGHGLMILGA